MIHLRLLFDIIPDARNIVNAKQNFENDKWQLSKQKPVICRLLVTIGYNIMRQTAVGVNKKQSVLSKFPSQPNGLWSVCSDRKDDRTTELFLTRGQTTISIVSFSWSICLSTANKKPTIRWD